MKPQWHRDRISQLSERLTVLRWKATILVTGLLGLTSLSFVIWYSDTSVLVRVLLVVVFIRIFYLIAKEIDKTIKIYNKSTQKMRNNYQELLSKK